VRESANIGHIQTDAWADTVGRTKKEGQEKVGDGRDGKIGMANQHGIPKGETCMGYILFKVLPLPTTSFFLPFVMLFRGGK
jgi:hypothetical protein